MASQEDQDRNEVDFSDTRASDVVRRKEDLVKQHPSYLQAQTLLQKVTDFIKQETSYLQHREKKNKRESNLRNRKELHIQGREERVEESGTGDA